jgi:hypothetical protein
VRCKILVSRSYSQPGRCAKTHNVKRGLCPVHRRMAQDLRAQTRRPGASVSLVGPGRRPVAPGVILAYLPSAHSTTANIARAITAPRVMPKKYPHGGTQDQFTAGEPSPCPRGPSPARPGGLSRP